MDGWFNSQKRTDAFGKEVLFHYKWNTQDEPGYSLVGHIFRNFGAETKELDEEPTAANLKGAQVYMIVSPDNAAKNPHPNFANSQDAEQIAQWVKAGGVLAIMENDTSFADLEHFNVIAEKFGMHFNSVLRKHVIGTNWEQGKIALDGSGPIFHHPHTIYVKDVCTISAKSPATPVLKEGDDIFMATAKYGKGPSLRSLIRGSTTNTPTVANCPPNTRTTRRRGACPLAAGTSAAQKIARANQFNSHHIVRRSSKCAKQILRSISVATPLRVCTGAATAQDTRKVVEPRIPQACITLEAAIAAPNGVISEKDEKALDTERIQKAMDTCAKGKAVVLRAKGEQECVS